MEPSLIQGRIVYPIDAVPDPLALTAKADRGFVVVTPDAVIRQGGKLKLVAIT